MRVFGFTLPSALLPALTPIVDKAAQPRRSSAMATTPKRSSIPAGRLLYLLTVVAFLSAAAPALFAQSTPSVPNSPSIDNALGTSPMAVYSVGEIDNVNPVTGNVFLNIPLLGYPQRGGHLRLQFRIYYNDKQWYLLNWPRVANDQFTPAQPPAFWTMVSTVQPVTNPQNMGVYVARDQYLNFGLDHARSAYTNFSGSGEYTFSADLKSYFVREANGAKHYIGDGEHKDCQGHGTFQGCPGVTYVSDIAEVRYPANDASGYVGNTGNLLQITGPDGVSYAADQSSGLETISDLMGNSISTNANGWTDTLGRNIPGSASGPGTSTGSVSSSQTDLPVVDLIPGIPMQGTGLCPQSTTGILTSARSWQVPGEGGSPRQYYLCYSTFSFQTTFNLNQTLGVSTYNGISEASGSAVMLSSIVMPNGQSYTFGYDPFLSLSHISTPTGASIDYTWQNIQPLDNSHDDHPLTRAIKKRVIHPGNNQPDRTWQYYWKTKTLVIVTDPSQNDVERAIDQSGVSQMRAYQGCGPNDDASDRACSGSGVLLRQEDYTRTSVGNKSASTPFAINAIAAQAETTTTTVTLPQSSGSLISQTVRTLTDPYADCDRTSMSNTPDGYTQAPTQHVTGCISFNSTKSVANYDFGSGTPGNLINTTTITYEFQTSSDYRNANLMNLIDHTTVSVPTGSSGGSAVIAGTQYGYDGAGSPQGVFGNQTSVTNGVDANASTTSFVYNSQGMVTAMKDGRHFQTQYNYDNSGLFPSSIQHPSTNNVSHTDSYNFDDISGLLQSQTDQNNQTTTYSYIDPATQNVDTMNRLHSSTPPQTQDGGTSSAGSGVTTYTYNDTPGSLSVRTDKKQSTNGSLIINTTYFDNLGETIRAENTSDPYGPMSSETMYDASGRVYTQRNPHRATTDPTTEGTTYHTYDGLGRQTLQTQPNGATQQWSYSAATTTFTDEASNSWTRTADALGRLTSVVEPNGGTAYYGYDGNGNLTAVSQQAPYGCHTNNGVISCTTATPASHNRTFQYDSQSRLLWANNPESGFICYGQGDGTQSGCGTLYYQSGYDGNGNLTTKTDARGVITSYVYDELNRLTSKTYSGANSAASAIAARTPASTYMYDTGVAAAVPNSVGRLVAESTGPAGSSVTLRSILNYDAAGRELSEQQCVSGSCAYPLQYSYDLMGEVTSSTDGRSSGVNLAYSYDAAGRLLTIKSNLSSPAYPATLFAPPSSGSQYGPAGLIAASLGVTASSQQAIYSLQRGYDNRLRLTSEIDQVTGGTPEPASGNITFIGGDGESYEVISGPGHGNPGGPPACGLTCSGQIPDAGTLSISLAAPGSSSAGFTASVDYDGEDDATLAAEVAAAFNAPDAQNHNPLVSATASGSFVGLTSLATGASSNYIMNVSVTNQDDYAYDVSGTTLTGGTDSAAQGTVYAYGIGYTGNSNVQAVSDSVMGNWMYSYDSLNRLATGQASANSQTGFAPYGSALLSWGYDAFGNYLGQSLSGTTQATVTQGSYQYNGANQISGSSYDASGNLLATSNSGALTYDAEGRVDTVSGLRYLYDAEGRRVAKETPTSTDEPPTYALSNFYVIGLNGERVSEFGGNTSPSNVYANGRLLATYDNRGLHFQFADWLGSRRVQMSGNGMVELTCQSLPYGDSQQCAGSGVDATEHHFTGKERDAESGLDYFGARYYASNMGRWMSPDWADKPEAVPYSDLMDPQSLNLYGYVRNNPLSKADPDGHEYICVPCLIAAVQQLVATHPGAVQEAKGVGELALGVGLVGTAALGDEPGAVAGAAIVTRAVLTTNSALGGTATAVMGVSDIIGGATNTDVAAGSSALSATGNLGGLVTTAATGSLAAGKVGATATSAATLHSNPEGALRNPATVIKAGKTIIGVNKLLDKAANAFNNAMAPTAPPPSPPPPSIPPCTVVGACQ